MQGLHGDECSGVDAVGWLQECCRSLCLALCLVAGLGSACCSVCTTAFSSLLSTDGDARSQKEERGINACRVL